MIPIQTSLIQFGYSITSTELKLVISQQPSPQTGAGIEQDPLIAKGGEKAIYIGIILLIVGALVVIGLVSWQVDRAIIFAGILTLLIMLFLLFFFSI